MGDEPSAGLAALTRRHRVALAIGGAVLLAIAAGNGAKPDSTAMGADQPVGGVGDASGASDAGDVPQFDERKWRDDQRRDSEEQRNRIDVIREVERCQLADGSVVEVPLGNCAQ